MKSGFFVRQLYIKRWETGAVITIKCCAFSFVCLHFIVEAENLVILQGVNFVPLLLLFSVGMYEPSFDHARAGVARLATSDKMRNGDLMFRGFCCGVERSKRFFGGL
jgi:hypothetical protein